MPAKQIYVNLPVSDLPKSRDFFSAIGFNFNEEYSDETAACVVIAEDIYVMLLTHPKFLEFSPNPVSDARTSTEVLVSLGVESKEEVDAMVAKAVAAGGSTYSEAQWHGGDFMYTHAFQDLDGHVWELVAANLNAVTAT